MIYYDSPEAEQLKKLIDSKKRYIQTITNKPYFQILQREIIFLDNDILPIVQRNTNIYHYEFAKHCVSYFDEAVNKRCNGLAIYQPINEDYTGQPLIGIANSRQLQKYGTYGAIELNITNMDGNGAEPIPLHIGLDK